MIICPFKPGESVYNVCGYVSVCVYVCTCVRVCVCLRQSVPFQPDSSFVSASATVCAFPAVGQQGEHRCQCDSFLVFKPKDAVNSHTVEVNAVT